MITKFEQYNESIKSLLVGPTKEETKDYWKNLGYEQSFETPEEFFLYMIDGIKIYKQTNCPDYIFWVKNNNIIFKHELKTKKLWVDYNSIWSVLMKLFGFDFVETQSFIKDQVEKHLNWKGLKTGTFTIPISVKLEEHLNWNNINKIKTIMNLNNN